MDSERIIVLITAPDHDTARQIATRLVEKKLAACANILPGVESIFRWQGEVQDESELLLVIKTRRELLHTQLIPEVKSLHPYQTPEIIALPVVDGASGYLDWMDQSTQVE